MNITDSLNSMLAETKGTKDLIGSVDYAEITNGLRERIRHIYGSAVAIDDFIRTNYRFLMENACVFKSERWGSGNTRTKLGGEYEDYHKYDADHYELSITTDDNGKLIEWECDHIHEDYRQELGSKYGFVHDEAFFFRADAPTEIKNILNGQEVKSIEKLENLNKQIDAADEYWNRIVPFILAKLLEHIKAIQARKLKAISTAIGADAPHRSVTITIDIPLNN